MQLKIHSTISFAAVISLSLAFTIVLAALAAKRDYSNIFLLTNSFPNPSAGQLEDIENKAFSTLLNAPPLSTISTNSLTNLKLIALNELFEVAFFTKLVANLTNKINSYDLNYGHDYILQTLKAVVTVNPQNNPQKYRFTNI